MKNEIKKERLIALAVTFLITLLLLLVLYFGGIKFDKALLAEASVPEIATLEDEELFIEPEVLTDLGEPDAVEQSEPAPVYKGEPEPAEKENTKLVVPDKNPKPAPPVEKPVTQKRESPVKATTPSATDEEKQKVTSALANKFGGNNGSKTGDKGSAGSGGSGAGVSGSVSGRTFKGCNKPSVSLRNKVTVVVNVTINAEGRVVSAKAKAGSGADAYIIKACEQAALTARWSEKKDAPEAKGTLTFTIIPK